MQSSSAASLPVENLEMWKDWVARNLQGSVSTPRILRIMQKLGVSHRDAERIIVETARSKEREHFRIALRQYLAGCLILLLSGAGGLLVSLEVLRIRDTGFIGLAGVAAIGLFQVLRGYREHRLAGRYLHPTDNSG